MQIFLSRTGNRPRTHQGLPHQQLDQQPLVKTIRRELAARLFALEGVIEAPSGISVPGARALVLRRGGPGPSDAFPVGREFAHLHQPPDQSLHIALPDRLAREAIAAGWAEYHPLVSEGRLPPTHVMVYAPREEIELEVVYALVCASYQFACDKKASTSVE